MQLKDAEEIFNRAVKFSLVKRKVLIVFPMLVLCGLLIVFCRALAVEASDWVILSLTFLPVFLSFGLLLATGAFLIKIYKGELAGERVPLSQIIKESWELFIGVSYLALPMLLTYLLLWTTLGIFYLLKEIPSIGPSIGVILSFGPFLLVLGCLMLSVLNLFILFFVTPHVALSEGGKWRRIGEAYRLVKENFFSHLILFTLAMLPLLFIVGLLSTAAKMTGATFLVSDGALVVALEWFFIMVPFSALLTPAVIFFFNFAAESTLYMLRQAKA